MLVYNILNADIDELHLYSTVKLPTVPRGSSEEAKRLQKIHLRKHVINYYHMVIMEQ